MPDFKMTQKQDEALKYIGGSYEIVHQWLDNTILIQIRIRLSS
jgi:hypothetical protein